MSFYFILMNIMLAVMVAGAIFICVRVLIAKPEKLPFKGMKIIMVMFSLIIVVSMAFSFSILWSVK